MAKVASIAAVPPPHDGMTIATEHAVQALRRNFDLYDLSIHARERQGGSSWRIERQIRFFGRTLLLPWMRVRGVRLVYLVCDSRWGLPRVLIQVATARLLGIPVLLHHQVARYIASRSPVMSVIVRTGGPMVTHVLLCDDLRRRFESLYAPNKTAILHNDFVLDAPANHDLRSRGMTPSGSRSSELVMGMLSNLTVDKGVDTFCEIAEDILQQGYDVRIMFAGPFRDEASQRCVTKLAEKYPARVDYVGSLYGVAKWEFLLHLDLFVFPTRYTNEAEPVVLYEAMRAGVPVATLDRACIKSQVGSSGWVEDSSEGLRRVLLSIAASGNTALQGAEDNLEATLHREDTWDERLSRLVRQAIMQSEASELA